MLKPNFKFKNGQGVTYSVFLKKPRKCEGICFNPQEEKPKIYINPRGKKGLLNTSIHEFAHAFFWGETETSVTKFANAISNFLYKQGWRRDESLAQEYKPRKKAKRKRVSKKKAKRNT